MTLHLRAARPRGGAAAVAEQRRSRGSGGALSRGAARAHPAAHCAGPRGASAASRRAAQHLHAAAAAAAGVTSPEEPSRGGAGGAGGSGRGGSGGGRPGRPGRGGGFGWHPPTGLLLLAATFVAEHVVDAADAAPPPLQPDSPQLAAALAALSPEALAAAVPKRIALFVEPSPFTYISGYATRFQNTIAQLVAQGAEVLVVTTGAGRSLPGVAFDSGAAQAPRSFAGATVVAAPSFGCPLHWQAPLSFALAPEVYAQLAAFRPDVVHVTTPGVMVLAASMYARRLDVPIVMSYHTDLPSYLPSYGLAWLRGAAWALIRLAHRCAHLSIAVSAPLAATLVEERASPAALTAAWRKAVDTERFSPAARCAEMRRRLSGVAPATSSSASAPALHADDMAGDADVADAPLLLYVGRLSVEKNVAALRPLLAALPRARLALVGDGPSRGELEAAFAADAATAGRVTFAGTLKGPALAAAFASADIFLMPSETETLGNVVLEAMASGLPVVAVAAGGVPDMITEPNVNGFLYGRGDGAAALAAAKALVEDAALRARVGAAARAESERWGWEAATRAMLYEQYPRAVAAHALGLHRPRSWRERKAAPAEVEAVPSAPAASPSRRGAMAVATTARLVALRRLAARSKLGRPGAARKAGRALVRRALATLV